ncbi:glucose 1-dehydrogenase [Ideonella sp. B508-1]|uniref:glucose 1-dehydrogenase n=1 Tax=Ideonella sp. B508-1 TaxID=137716 RepID=UPI000347E827|nr:glucose 1-dehydrogenase [Ideonella sp. B508-1]
MFEHRNEVAGTWGRLEGKVAIVTGACRGIGRAVVERFGQEGARVLATDLHPLGVDELCALRPGAVVFAQHDVTQQAAWERVFDEAASAWGVVDVLVNNAGIAVPADVEAETLEGWRRTQAVNLDAVFMGTQVAILRMKHRPSASIVNIASIEGLLGEPLVPAYNASKGGVRIFTKSAAVHCARLGYGIRVNAVCPGFIATPMISGAMSGLDEAKAAAFTQAVLGRVPMGRLGEAHEVAQAVLFLASDEASFINGADLVVDGGHTAC